MISSILQSSLKTTDNSYSGSNIAEGKTFTSVADYSNWLSGQFNDISNTWQQSTFRQMLTNGAVTYDSNLLSLQNGPLSIALAQQKPDALSIYHHHCV